MKIIAIILIIVFLFMIIFILFWKLIFLRNPKRIIPKGNNIVSPADGKVINIIKFKDISKIKLFKGNKKYLGIIKTLTSDIAKRGYIISIFMNPFNVHYNRTPIEGKIISVKHSKGKLLAVNTLKAGLENEKTETIIDGKIKIKVIQIAGLLASHIITYISLGKNVKKGEVFGLINLGSQVTMILPENVNIKILEGQNVYAGKTIIADII